MSNRIKNVWMGAIFMESKIEHMGSQPQFSNLAEASKCYLVEYNVPIYSWKFFWSIPGKLGQDGVFKTEAMKEDPPQNGERYWNDAGEDPIVDGWVSDPNKEDTNWCTPSSDVFHSISGCLGS